MNTTMIAQVSGGLTSFWALKKTLEVYPKEQIDAVFADTGIEDPDLYRFLDDQETFFQLSIRRLKNERNVFEVWKKERCITIPRNDTAPCSNILKRQRIASYLTETYAGKPYTLVFGMDYTEIHRVTRLQQRYESTWFPLLEPPLVEKCDIAAFLHEQGIAIPRLYQMGFEHNNCGGACVRAGIGHFARLFDVLPDVYRRWEQEEQEFQVYLGKPVTILRRKRQGETQRLSLAQLRQELENGYRPASYGIQEACGCFLSGEEV